MSSQKKIRNLKKNVLELEAKLREVRSGKDRFVLNLQSLNQRYRDSELSYEEYTTLWHSHLAGRAPRDWAIYYNKQAEYIIHQIATLRAELRAEEKARKNVSKLTTTSIALMMLLALISGVSMIEMADIYSITGAAVDEGTAESVAQIQVYISAALSNNLADGISFGSLSHNTLNNNATDNYNGGSYGSTMFVNVSLDSNRNVDFCVRANDSMKSSTDSNTIEPENMTWSNATSTSATIPAGPGGSTPMTTSFALGDENTAPGNSEYYRFWLDVPEAQPDRSYNNGIIFKIVQTGTGC